LRRLSDERIPVPVVAFACRKKRLSVSLTRGEMRHQPSRNIARYVSGGVAIETAGFRRFLLALGCHSGGVFAVWLAAWTEFLPREVVLGGPIFFMDLSG
jgi:hypothetical protein